jgi:NADH-quinone oxidoreductase subunit L
MHVEPALAPLWLIALFPLLGAFANVLFGRRLQRSAFGEALAKRLHIGSLGVTLIAIGAVGASFAIVVAHTIHLAQLPPDHRYLYDFAWRMVRIGSLDVSFSFAFDPLTAVMTLVITGVGALIHVYAASYMAKDPSYWRFFSCLNFFIFAMLLLVLADNFIVMFFGWEGVALASYLLIGFWYKDRQKAVAGTKAFIVNRIGDFGFLAGLCVLFWSLGGQWVGSSYAPTDQERFVAVPVKSTNDRAPATPSIETDEQALREATARKTAALSGGMGSLTMTDYAGARVYIGLYDGADLAANPPPEPFAIAPFIRRELPAGRTSIAIVPGDGALVGGGYEAALLRAVAIDPGQETELSVLGPTVRFRGIESQLSMRDSDNKAFVRDALQENTLWGTNSITLACLLLFLAAMSKSAQLPLHVWLPDAMAGPTPVSALIHAATMVTAGVYLIARLSFLFALSPVACGVIALVGATTALFAATVGLFQYDIKRVLAYSTVSQLGFMFMGAGAGAYWASVFHLVTHAFFKACLFLAAGSVIHGMHAISSDESVSQDMRRMGGLRRVMPKTARAYLLACIAITAAPIPFFAGFWSKDEILWRAFTTENTGPVPGFAIYAMGLVAAAMTSFYAWRSYFLTFEGEHATPDIATRVHESPGLMVYILTVLGALSVVSGAVLGFSPHLIGGDGHAILDTWLAPIFAHADVSFTSRGRTFELVLMAVSVCAAFWAWRAARRRYAAARAKSWQDQERRTPGYALLSNAYGVDSFYARTVVRAFMALRLVCAAIDRRVIDAFVDGTGVATRATADAVGAADRQLVDGVVNGVADGTLVMGGRLRTLQTGRIQTYIYGLLVGIAVLSLIHYALR